MKVAVVQPRTIIGSNEERNVEHAIELIEEAANQGSKIVCFPETYPGPFRQPITYSPLSKLGQCAKANDVYVVAGTIEHVDDSHCYNIAALIGPDGNVVGKYNRTTPTGPWIYKAKNQKAMWDFNYLAADDLPVFKTEYGTVGLLICSEVYMPELARILALKGAEIVFLPAGGAKSGLWETWRTLIFARAIENLMYTATCQNLTGSEDGLAMIASPEGILVESKEEGVYTADVDLDRVRTLRATPNDEDEREKLLHPKTKPGLLKYWRRPEIYVKSKLVVP
ncbi:MAG TPA: carbon-nitrogen hydrolase family protein [Candidatus Bathyarchaeia archaeon]|nr:carbon-nitrogen hydrolase family protein [Candidatus Bathyarchaeia archaeon]